MPLSASKLQQVKKPSSRSDTAILHFAFLSAIAESVGGLIFELKNYPLSACPEQA